MSNQPPLESIIVFFVTRREQMNIERSYPHKLFYLKQQTIAN